MICGPAATRRPHSPRPQQPHDKEEATCGCCTCAVFRVPCYDWLLRWAFCAVARACFHWSECLT